MVLRADKTTILEEGLSLIINTDIVVGRETAFLTPKILVQITALSSHWLAPFARRSFTVKTGFLDPTFVGRLTVQLYNHNLTCPIQILQDSPVAELLVAPYSFKA